MILTRCSASQGPDVVVRSSKTDRIEDPYLVIGNTVISVVLVALLDRGALLGARCVKPVIKGTSNKGYVDHLSISVSF